MARIHYDILRVQPDASAEEIQRAYRRLALHYHPDHNSAPDAAAHMAAINEAYKTLHDPVRTAPVESPVAAKPVRRDDLTDSILRAARVVIERNGWTARNEDAHTVLFEVGTPRVRVVLTDRLTKDSLLRIARQYREISAVLAVHIEVPLADGSRLVVVDLLHAERHGAAIPDGPCKSLLSGFL